MSKRTLEPPLLGVVAAYFVLLLLAAWPITDFLMSTLPPRWGTLEWRFGAAGLMAGYVLLPTLGIGLLMALAFGLRHTRVLRLLSLLSFAGAALLLLVILSLGLDLIRIGGLDVTERLYSLRRGTVVAEFKHFSAFVALGLLGVAGWQASRRLVDESPVSKGPGVQTRWLGAKSDKSDRDRTP
jgi:hypothetical protein